MMCRELAGLPAAAVGEAVKIEISAKGPDKVSYKRGHSNTTVAFKTDRDST